MQLSEVLDNWNRVLRNKARQMSSPQRQVRPGHFQMTTETVWTPKVISGRRQLLPSGHKAFFQWKAARGGFTQTSLAGQKQIVGMDIGSVLAILRQMGITDNQISRDGNMLRVSVPRCKKRKFSQC